MQITNQIFWCMMICCQIPAFVLSHSTIEEAQHINASPLRKYKKKLRKEEGAIRLVGGSNDYEGTTINWLKRLNFHFKAVFFSICFNNKR